LIIVDDGFRDSTRDIRDAYTTGEIRSKDIDVVVVRGLTDAKRISDGGACLRSQGVLRR
jgi:hypothetical protein